jgi:hypothetical protein
MITQRIKITAYRKDTNDCEAILQNGDVIIFDPFVSCALFLSDEDYRLMRGSDIVGNTYLLTEYSVYPHNVVPHENGMILIEDGS